MKNKTKKETTNLCSHILLEIREELKMMRIKNEEILEEKFKDITNVIERSSLLVINYMTAMNSGSGVIKNAKK